MDFVKDLFYAKSDNSPENLTGNQTRYYLSFLPFVPIGVVDKLGEKGIEWEAQQLSVIQKGLNKHVKARNRPVYTCTINYLPNSSLFKRIKGFLSTIDGANGFVLTPYTVTLFVFEYNISSLTVYYGGCLENYDPSQSRTREIKELQMSFKFRNRVQIPLSFNIF